MNRQSPLTVTYKTLTALAEEVLRESEGRYKIAQGRISGSLDPLKARVENAKVLVKMLKKCEPGKQNDLFQIFQLVTK